MKVRGKPLPSHVKADLLAQAKNAETRGDNRTAIALITEAYPENFVRFVS
jgi:hypothetical protein